VERSRSRSKLAPWSTQASSIAGEAQLRLDRLGTLVPVRERRSQEGEQAAVGASQGTTAVPLSNRTCAGAVRRAIPVALLALLAGCGWVMPDGTVPAAPAGDPPAPPVVEMEEPPLARVNDVPGALGSFCWTSGCADTVGLPPDAPPVSAPLRVELPPGAGEVHASAIGPDGHASIELAVKDGVVDPLPAGTVGLMISAWFPQGGNVTFDASYYWRIAEAQDSGESSPSP
jgi:hypothetical protein